jgi:fatty acid desaturase
LNELDTSKEAGKRRGRRTVAILWWIAAGCSVLAVTLEYINTGKVRPTQAVMALAFIMLAIVMQRAKTR